MIKRTLYQFDLVTGDDDSREEVSKLGLTLKALLTNPGVDVRWYSAKTDTVVLTIEIDEDAP